MKAVFPCKGVVVVTKQNVDIIANFYEGNLINSKLYQSYMQSNFAIQVGAFNYMPQNSKIILDRNANLLTIRELNQVLSQTAQKAVDAKPVMQNTENTTSVQKGDMPIEDSFVMNHPFFQTLKPLN